MVRRILILALKRGNLTNSSYEPQIIIGNSDLEKQSSTYKNTSIRESSPIKLYSSEDNEDYHPANKSNNNRENEIQIENERYRQSLQNELLKVITEEKENEEERELFYNRIADEEEKKKTEILINLQRSECSRRIVLMKQ